MKFGFRLRLALTALLLFPFALASPLLRGNDNYHEMTDAELEKAMHRSCRASSWDPAKTSPASSAMPSPSAAKPTYRSIWKE